MYINIGNKWSICALQPLSNTDSVNFKLFETFPKFRLFVFRDRATNENAELEENRTRVIFHWENLWKGVRIGSGIILRLFYQRRKEIMIFRGFREFREFRGIDLAICLVIPPLLLHIFWQVVQVYFPGSI